MLRSGGVELQSCRRIIIRGREGGVGVADGEGETDGPQRPGDPLQSRRRRQTTPSRPACGGSLEEFLAVATNSEEVLWGFWEQSKNVWLLPPRAASRCG